MTPDTLSLVDAALTAGRASQVDAAPVSARPRRLAGPTRAAILTDDVEHRGKVLLAALKAGWPKIEVRALRPEKDGGERLMEGGTAARPSWRTALSDLLLRLPFSTVVQLAAYRPDLVISEGFGTKTLRAALYRSLSWRSRLLLCATEPPRRFSLVERLVLSVADGVLAEEDAVAHAIECLGVPSLRIFPASVPHDVAAFLSCSRTRSGPEAHRLIHVGDLTPHSGVADALICVAVWAERHPDRTAEIWWAGEGDLAGVLEAQPLPANVSQRFVGRLDARDMAAAFAQCGLLIAPCLGDDHPPPIAEALAAGLVVLGSLRSRRVRQLVREDVSGWAFDPVRPDDMLRVLDRALGCSPERLDSMRDGWNTLVRALPSPDLSERLRRAVASVLAGAALQPDVALDAS